MSVDAHLQPLFERIEADRACRYRADATPGDIARLEATLKFPLPPSYLAFLRRFNGVGGYPFRLGGARPRWVAGEPLEAVGFRDHVDIPEVARGRHIPFGTSGHGGFVCFDRTFVPRGECSVVRWSWDDDQDAHLDPFADSFATALKRSLDLGWHEARNATRIYLFLAADRLLPRAQGAGSMVIARETERVPFKGMLTVPAVPAFGRQRLRRPFACSARFRGRGRPLWARLADFVTRPPSPPGNRLGKDEMEELSGYLEHAARVAGPVEVFAFAHASLSAHPQYRVPVGELSLGGTRTTLYLGDHVEVAAGGRVTEIPFDHGALVADEAPAKG